MSFRSGRGAIPPRMLPPARPAQPMRAPQATLPQAALGDPGYGGSMGGGVSPVDLRRALDPITAAIGELQTRMQNANGRDESLGVLQELIRSNSFGTDDMLAGLGQDVLEGIRGGKCLPYMAGIDIFVPKGVSGVEVPAGEIFIASDGPMFITQLLAYAQIDSNDPDAATYPYSLIRSPSCSANNADIFASVNDSATFTASPQSLVPALNAQGRFIPVSPTNCKVISPTVETVCFTQDCADGSTPKQFAAQVPIVLLDHPECVDGLVSIQTNGCIWQNQSFPIAFFEDVMFDLTTNTPDPLGIVGFLDCNKRLDTRFQPTRPMRYDINLSFLFAGFRVVTCGSGACGTG